MPQTITITITVPDDVNVQVEATPSPSVADRALPSNVVDRIRRSPWAEWEEAWARWALDTHNVRVVRAKAIQAGRINAYPPPDGGSGRIAAMYAPSGRLAFPTLSHDHADGVHSKPIWNVARDGSSRTPAGVAVLLHSSEELKVAKHLTEVALGHA